jgi:hypothetical protein
MQKTSNCCEANNNIDFLYILSNSNLNPHIDRIYFSCNSEIVKPVEKLVSILEENNYECKRGYFAKGRVYKRIRIFESSITGIKISILYGRNKESAFYPCIGITIHKPDLKTVNWFDTICNSLGFETTLSHVELALDIYPYSYNLKEFFQNHLVLKYHRGDSCYFYGDDDISYYIGNKRKNTKSAIIYARPKDKIEKDLLRVELRFSRKFLKSREINLDSFEKINDLDLTKLISFKELNQQKLTKHLLWSQKSQLALLPEAKRKQFERLLNRYPFSVEGTVEQLSFVKHTGWVDQHSRFFIDMDEANEAFFGKLKGLRII